MVAQPILGERLRVLRRVRDCSLAEVAEATDISVSFLSLLESGRTDITTGRLLRLVRFYGVPVTDLLPGDSAEPVVVSATKRKRLETNGNGVETFALAAGANEVLKGLIAVLEAGAEARQPADVGACLLLIMHGNLELDINSQLIRLSVGDSVYLAGSPIYALRNAGDTQAHVLIVTTPASR